VQVIDPEAGDREVDGKVGAGLRRAFEAEPFGARPAQAEVEVRFDAVPREDRREE
jgi:hypothetical protein